VFRLQEHLLLLEGVSSAGASASYCLWRARSSFPTEQIWPTHKWLCGKDAFSFPPLSKLEISHLEAIKDKMFSDGASSVYSSWQSYLLVTGVFNQSWQASFPSSCPPHPG
jgi:hypothetical protein